MQPHNGPPSTTFQHSTPGNNYDNGQTYHEPSQSSFQYQRHQQQGFPNQRNPNQDNSYAYQEYNSPQDHSNQGYQPQQGHPGQPQYNGQNGYQSNHQQKLNIGSILSNVMQLVKGSTSKGPKSNKTGFF